MKAFTIKDHPCDGEFIVGPTVIGSRSTYLVFNEVAPGQTVPLRAGHGHEEIFLVVAGSGLLRLGGEEQLLTAGQGAYLGEGPDGTVTAEGPTPLHYVCAGGHVPGGHHH
jgi:mannose-6-phosphate isomerase-like protein (cupin superfamily)